MARDWQKTITSLFAKAEDPTIPEDERNALTDKALGLMAEKGIDDAMLAEAGHLKDEMSNKIISFDAPYAATKARLYAAIARSFRCVVVQLRGKQGYHVFGWRSDIEKTDDLYDYVLKYGVWSLNQAMEDRDPFEHLKTFTVSFWDGFMVTITRRLTEMNRQENVKANAANTGTALVLVKREAAVNKAVSKVFPRLTHTSRYGNGGSGYGAGKAAGNAMGLGRGGSLGGRKALSGRSS